MLSPWDVIERLRAVEKPDRALDADVARALGFRIAASTRGPQIMREGSVASWDLPAYTATTESRSAAIRKLRDRANVTPGYCRHGYNIDMGVLCPVCDS